MKPNVVTNFGQSSDGKLFSVAIFVLDLPTSADAQRLMPILKATVEEKIMETLRGGIHSVPPPDGERPTKH